MRRLLRRLGVDRRGVSAVEFALIAPMMIFSYFALAEFSGALLAERKSSQIASEVGDLVAQDSSINASEMTDIFSIANTVMAPLPTSSLNMRVTSIVANAQDATTVSWSSVNSTGTWSALTAGSSITVPAGLVPANGSIIRSEVQYSYTSPISYFIPLPKTFSQVFYLVPRQSTAVVWASS